MDINDRCFYEMMGDYHFDMAGYILPVSINQYCQYQASYHEKQYKEYDKKVFLA